MGSILTTLGDQISTKASESAARKRQARANYAGLLSRRADLKPADNVWLAEVMDALGLTAADVQADVQALDAVASAKADIPVAEKRAAIEAEVFAAAEHVKETEKAFEAAKERLKQAGYANVTAQWAIDRAFKAEREARQRSPRAFGVWPD